jgi:hypothetical protein
MNTLSFFHSMQILAGLVLILKVINFLDFFYHWQINMYDLFLSISILKMLRQRIES